MEFTIDNLDTIAYCVAQERSKQEQALASPKSNDFIRETARQALKQMQNISDKMVTQMERTVKWT
jgi:RNase P subunit RPR2